MRKYLAAALLAVLFLLSLAGCSGCSGGQTQESAIQKLTSFSCKANITYGDFTASADVTRQADGETVFVLTEPESLRDMTFLFRSDQVSISYKGLTIDVSPTSFLASAAGSALVNSIDQTLKSENVEITKKDGVLEINSKSNSGNYTMQLDQTTGALLKLLVPSLDLQCDFTEFQPLGS